MQGPIQVISIHALREEGDHGLGQRQSTCQQFLSTPSARRATRARRTAHISCVISIHALREEGDSKTLPKHRRIWPFLSTPSARRATDMTTPISRDSKISIHALREEGDQHSGTRRPSLKRFLSTPSARRATYNFVRNHAECLFLSTPSARRATDEQTYVYQVLYNFYPRPPRGGRQQKQRQNLYFQTNYTTFCTNLEEP